MASSSRGVQQDSFIDEDDLTCPLCVEEFDLSDRNFRPCPCGYQVCQFCFNNIKTNMNGLCPACRRPYDEKTIEWKVVTPEEIAQFKAKIQKDAKKKAELRQKEAQKREVENLNRKHLAGLRVVQKNLVYVVGLSHGIPEQDLLQTLRGEKYFGQYGKIIKIVVSKAKSGDPNSSLGVYVTFARKEDAARCIAAVNGSTNLDRVLRAQLGTTKYCSAYLRNETCTNKQCMFLHEPGDNEDSYSRQDLSSINSVGTQRPLASTSISSRQVSQTQAPIQQAQLVAAASQPMVRELSKDGSDSGDGSALPSSASWANRGTQQLSRSGSGTTSRATSSPDVSASIPVQADVSEDFQESVGEQDQVQGDSPIEQTSALPTSSESRRPHGNPVLMRLLKSISGLKICAASSTESDFDGMAFSSFPPLFDDQGGLKRKALREQQAETRLHSDQDSQQDLHSISDHQEEEENPESGSLQLGGEPEDRNETREGNTPIQSFHDQRRPSVQLPIHRASHDNGLFGGSLSQNTTRNLGNLTSINGRTLTPLQLQQLMLLKSGQAQPGFMDQFPPGMAGSSQSSVFQHQGHNRQSSRYNFANDNAAASSAIKATANSKIGPQSSMMSSPQYYGSSISGPPPGLKSTGTPPMSGGGIFGQNQGFGNSLGGNSAFGGAKDNNSDMLREMLRSRGGMASGGQVHDAGKREFMFPSFLHQYPSVSTPAPASGLLASLYGPQPGAFQDFGSKQKKKGKKHRHANTSSSGGGGLVDLADPNMFQARMPLQQQSNAGVGQGLFGGQGQDDYVLPSLDEASMSVDALVADSANDFGSAHAQSNIGTVSRSSTPSAPPGLSLPHAHPSPVFKDDSGVKSRSRIVPTSAPFSPSRISHPPYGPRVANSLAQMSVPSGAISKTSQASISQARQDVRSLATNSGLSRAIASYIPHGITSQTQILRPDDFPVLEKGKEKFDLSAKTTKVSTPISKKAQIAANELASSLSSATKSAGKRSTPGVLSIIVPGQSITKGASGDDVTTNTIRISAAFPPLPPIAPSSTTVQTPAVRTNSKTLRLVPTPRMEAAHLPGSTPQSASVSNPPTFPLSNRQPSIASISKIDCPSTPVSEIISDNASVTSNPLSRPSSPPATRVGSAPMRSTTKSQQKKQRREAQKEKEKSELDTVVDKPEAEIEIAPIMGRKKKQKREKNSSSAGISTPIISRASSPRPQQGVEEDRTSNQEANFEQYKDTHPGQARVDTLEDVPAMVPNVKTKSGETIPPQLLAPTIENVDETESNEKPVPTPSSILSDLVSSGLLPDPHKLIVFKSPGAFNYRTDISGDHQDIDLKLFITEEDRAALHAGKPVYKVAQGNSRIMLTPNGDCVRNLTPAEEERYLELQSRILKDSGPAAFVPARHNASHGFMLIGGRAVPNGPPAFFPPVDNITTTALDPVSKIQRDEALSYINQYVLPSLSTNSQLERALNANALDGEALRPGDSQPYVPWSGTVAASPSPSRSEITDRLHTERENDRQTMPYGPSTASEGILATGLESMTAHFAINREPSRSQHLGSVTLLSLVDSENAMQNAKKETEKLEKSLNQLLKKNRRLLLGAGH